MTLGSSLLTRQTWLILGLLAACALWLAVPADAQQASRVPVTGLPASFNDDLRRLLKEEPPPASLFDARRQAERAAGVVARLLESEGYYQAEVQAFAEGVETFTRGVRVTTGALFIINARAIAYLGDPPDQQTGDELDSLLAPLSPGAPARAAPVLETEDAILRRLRMSGYPDARAEPVDALADGKQQTLDFTFQIQPGFRTAFGDASFTGLDRTRETFVQRLKPWKPGDIYSQGKLDEFRARLAETGLFDTASARLAPQGANTSQPISRDVLVEVREGKRHTIALGASASTSEGFGVESEWTRRNITGRGDSVTVGAQAAEKDSHIETSYRRPHVGQYGRNVTIGANIENLETDAYDQFGGGLNATVEQPITPRLRGSVGVEASYASIADQRARIVGGTRREIYLVGGSGTAEYIGVRDVLDPHNGVRARLAVEPAVTWGDSRIGFTRLAGEASGYVDLGAETLSLAGRAKLGAILGPEGAPPDRLFFAGGGGSVRGYDYQSLSPRDSADELIGGRSLVEMSAELRWKPGRNLGYVAFVDAGAAGAYVEPPIDAMGLGAGVGLRYFTGFGPLRADLAFPLDKRSGDADFQIYISIGQAF